MIRGKVVKIDQDKNFGFIKDEKGNSFYFNNECMEDNKDFRLLKKGSLLKFKSISQSNQKNEKAIGCKIVEDDDIEYFKEKALVLDCIEDYDLFCDKAKGYAIKLKVGKVTTSMIRKIYSRILNANNTKEIKLLRPQFAYTAGRHENNNLRQFMDLLDNLARAMEIDNERQLKNFKQFMEAIVAYRKYAGGDK